MCRVNRVVVWLGQRKCAVSTRRSSSTRKKDWTCQRDRQTDGETDGQTDRQWDGHEGLDMSERQTDRWRDRQTDGQTDRQWDGHEGLDMVDERLDYLTTPRRNSAVPQRTSSTSASCFSCCRRRHTKVTPVEGDNVCAELCYLRCHAYGVIDVIPRSGRSLLMSPLRCCPW